MTSAVEAMASRPVNPLRLNRRYINTGRRESGKIFYLSELKEALLPPRRRSKNLAMVKTSVRERRLIN
jgi:hypothetical protein